MRLVKRAYTRSIWFGIGILCAKTVLIIMMWQTKTLVEQLHIFLVAQGFNLNKFSIKDLARST